jgi:asparagine synthase (glutamine-hydrolysing)
MCGIVGIAYADQGRKVDPQVLDRCCDALSHRGPDDRGTYCAPGIGLGSRRLAILDLSPRGHMPMASPDGRYVIVYNGEVYNYRELRPGLEQRGIRFQSNSDTEVLLHLYITEGPAMLQRLNGMFAMAIWDGAERSLFVARDRLGIKPLYYSQAPDRLIFGSEEKALFTGGVEPRCDPDSWEELLTFRFVSGERTPFEGVHRLLPGHYFEWRNGEIRMVRWWHLGERVLALRAQQADDPVAWFRRTFDESIAYRLISDVPVGVFLSGGLDSSSVAAAMKRQATGRISSFTVRFPDAEYDEGPLARLVARENDLDYQELEVPASDLAGLLRQASWYNDEPLAHASDVHLHAIARYAKSRVTVLLSGEGSDEFHGGYVRYRPLRHERLLALGRAALPLLRLGSPVHRRVRRLARFLALEDIDEMVLFNAANVFPEDLEEAGLNPSRRFPYRESILAEARDLYPGDRMRQAMFLDQHTFLCSLLDRNDRMTMGASIECRVPFLDYRIVERLATLPTRELLPGRESKPLLRHALGDRLPREVLEGRKWGFGVPWSTYFRTVPELQDLVRNLPGHPIVQESPLNGKRLRAIIEDFLEGSPRQEPLITQLVMLAIWKDNYLTMFRGSGADAEPRPVIGSGV